MDKFYYTDEDIKLAKIITERVTKDSKIRIDGNLQGTQGSNGLEEIIDSLRKGHSGDNSSMITILSQLNY